MGNWLNKREEEKKEIRYILSIDGGGMRGVVPAYLLSKLNKKLKEYSDRPLYSYFDLIAGTSTGALLALGLSLNNSNSSFKLEAGADYPLYETRKYKKLFKVHSEQVLKGYIKKSTDPDALVSLYKENGCKIFHQPSHFKKILGNVFSDKYDASSLESFMNEIYGDTPLSDALVPTINVHVVSGVIVLLLFIFAKGIIKGFAITLLIGVVLSMITAIVLSRFILKLLMLLNTIFKLLLDTHLLEQKSRLSLNHILKQKTLLIWRN